MYTNFASLITINYFKDNFPGGEKIQEKDIKCAIEIAQQKYMPLALGSSLYNDICSYVALNYQSGTTIPDNYVFLRENYIAQYLLQVTALEVMPSQFVLQSGIGLQQRTSEFSVPVSNQTKAQFIDGINNNAEFYKDRLQYHLCQNNTLYPKFNESEIAENVPPQTTNMIGGLFLY